MKRILLAVAIIATSLIALTGCEKQSGAEPKLMLPVTGEWRITYYYENDSVSTNDYTDYVFDFKLKNAITATINGRSSNGYWAISAEGARQEFNIGFNTGDPKLSRLNDDWKVIRVTESEVLLTEDGDEVHFIREQP